MQIHFENRLILTMLVMMDAKRIITEETKRLDAYEVLDGLSARAARMGSIMIFSDKDDTTTCPARGAAERKFGDKAKGFVAGVDTCGAGSKYQMEAEEIYFGYGLFLHLLAAGFQQASYNIISANPFAHGFPHIKSYLETVTRSCPDVLVKESRGQLQVPQLAIGGDYVYGGLLKKSAPLRSTDHMSMGVHKLEQLMNATETYQPNRAVFIGDTGQGDTCAGVCFVDPQNCRKNAPGFYAYILSVKATHPKAAGILSWQAPPHVLRAGLFHDVGIPSGVYPVAGQYARAKTQCYESVRRGRVAGKIALFSQKDPSNPRNEYAAPRGNSALMSAIRIGLVPDVRRIAEHVYYGEVNDCIPGALDFDLYRK